MKQLKLLLILGLAIINFTTSTYAQTQVGLFTGIDALRLSSQEINTNCLHSFIPEGCIGKGFFVNTPLIGLSVNQMISPKIAFTYQVSYAKKKIDYIYVLHGSFYDHIGKHVEFNHFTHQLGVNYYLSERLHIGVAWALQQYRNIKLSFERPHIDGIEIPDRQVEDNKHQYGGAFRVGYSIQHINIEASFYQGINTSKISDWEYVEINTSQQIALTVGYMFNLKFRTRKNKTACPKF